MMNNNSIQITRWKRRMGVFFLFAVHFLFFISILAAQETSLSPLITDRMVLQRNKPNVLKGSGVPGQELTLKLAGRKYDTTVCPDGSWRIQTNVLSAGGPYLLTVISGRDTLEVNEVRIGDVWICSGQSNMEFTVGAFSWAEQEKEKAQEDVIWFYTLPNTLDLIPSSDVPASQWKSATGEDLFRLSATAYFFARQIQPEAGVPVGLIVSAWSGTAIEPWMEKESLRDFPQFAEVLEELDGYTQSKEKVEEEFARYRAAGWDENYYLAGKGIKQKWYLPETDFSNWHPIRNPGYWEDMGIGLDTFDGAVWYKTEFDLPENFEASSFHLFLSYIKDYNRVWVNGEFVGETFGDKNWSDYYVPATILKPKGNILVVRIFNIEGKGGINYHPLWQTPILAGEWVCKAEDPMDLQQFPKPQIVNVNPFSTPTLLYNAMIHPLKDCAITGFIWYQGESNVGRGYEYRTLFPVLIESWRRLFDQGNLPFYFVQLANHLPEAGEPGDSQWAELRESQQETLKLPGTGMAVTIDIGEAADIHPQNKQEVGRRLGLQALAKVYGKQIECESPRFESASFEPGRAIVTLQTVSALQKVNPADPVEGFELAGADGRFFRAEVEEIRDKTVSVSAPEVEHPVAVRYAWANNPGRLNLENAAGLPVAPFRSDQWEGITDKRTFDLHIIYF